MKIVQMRKISDDKKPNRKKKIKLLIIAVLVICIIGSYLKVEILTLFYGNQFEDLYNASGWVDSLTYFKVMKYSKYKADVYYADLDSTDDTTGATFLYHFQKDSGQWVLDSWECIWSEGGSADKFIWPYYFH